MRYDTIFTISALSWSLAVANETNNEVLHQMGIVAVTLGNSAVTVESVKCGVSFYQQSLNSPRTLSANLNDEEREAEILLFVDKKGSQPPMSAAVK